MIDLVSAGAAGFVVGAFSNIAIERLPPVEGLRPPGLISGVLLRVQLRRALVALLAAGLFVLAWDRFGDDPFRAAAVAGFAAVFLALAFIDLETFFLPDRIIFPATAVALLVSPLWPHIRVWECVAGAFVGLAVFYPFAWYGDRKGRDIMGWGDVKFGALLGAVLGLQFLLLGLYLGVLIGGVVGIGALVARMLGARVTLLPYGPSLAAGGLIALYAGRPIMDWVLASFS